jgi:HD superfamily phosphohydrolase
LGRELRDPIHGFIARTELEQELIDSSVFQRLRRIRQLALASLVYPGALHTRFDHSIGAMHVAGKIADAVGLDSEESRLVRLAALLHDIGHGPFSHVSEPILETFASIPREKRQKQIHEMLTDRIISTDKSLARVLSDRDREHIIGILDGVRDDSVMKDIVSGPLDADKQDYLLRDSYFCGVKYGVYDLDRLIGTLCTHIDKEDRYLAIDDDGVNALEQFVLAKYYMTIQVYRHKIRLITDLMTERALRLGIEKDDISVMSH